MRNKTTNTLTAVTLRLTVSGWFGLGLASQACRAADLPPAADQTVIAHREALQNDVELVGGCAEYDAYATVACGCVPR